MNSNTIVGSAGGIARAPVARAEALAKFYAIPKLCKQCQTRIEVRDHERPAEVRKRMFCSQSCAAKFNNKGTKRGPKKRLKSCKECGTVCKPNLLYCNDQCKELTRAAKASRLTQTTKGELFKERPTWQAEGQFFKGTLDVYSSLPSRPLVAMCAGTQNT